MANTGYAQATIAYKVSRFNGAPLDVNGVPTSVSGRRQAIALLTGATNPDPAMYEVERYFGPRENITGNPTLTQSEDCAPAGLFTVTPSTLLLGPDNPQDVITVTSPSDWYIQAVPPFVSFSTTSGGAGVTVITASATATEGLGYVTFVNAATGETAQVYISNFAVRDWILDTGNWNMAGFWYDNEVWNF